MNDRRVNFLLGEINRSLDTKTREESLVREQEARERDANAQRTRSQKSARELAMAAKRGSMDLAAERNENRDKNIAARMIEQKRLMAATARPERKNEELERKNDARVRQQSMERQYVRQRSRI